MWEKLALNYSKKKGGGIQSNNLCTWKLTPWVGSTGLANNLWWPSSHHEQEDENKIQNDFNEKSHDDGLASKELQRTLASTRTRVS